MSLASIGKQLLDTVATPSQPYYLSKPNYNSMIKKATSDNVTLITVVLIGILIVMVLILYIIADLTGYRESLFGEEKLIEQPKNKQYKHMKEKIQTEQETFDSNETTYVCDKEGKCVKKQTEKFLECNSDGCKEVFRFVD